MKKLHIRQNAQWLPVFCQNNGKIITCADSPKKALPQKAIWADSDLKYFQNNYSNFKFALINI